MPGRPKRRMTSRLGAQAPRESTGLIGSGERAPDGRYDPARIRSASSGLRRVGLWDGLGIARDTEAAHRFDDEPLEPVPAPPAEQTDDEITDALYRHLHAGRGDKASGLIQLLFLAGRSVAQIIDSSLRRALERLGEDQAHRGGDDGRGQRATEICIRILHELPGCATPAIAPMTAVGAAPPDDPFVLPSMAAASVLESIGFDVTNLGPETPTATLVDTIDELRPSIAWLSVTAEPDPDTLRSDVLWVLEACEAAWATLMIGGRQAHRFCPPDHPRLLLGDSMVELAAFATGLTHRADRKR